ncbi:MAG TPA: hypothetical protein VID93_06700 [Acidimicrobiales bacterium]
MRRRIAVALAVSVLVVACASRNGQVGVGPPGQAKSAGQRATPRESGSTPVLSGSITDSPVVRLAGPRAKQPYDAFLARVVTDIESFWETTYPTIAGGEPYLPLEGGVWPVWPEADTVPGCGSGRTSYREVEDNAFYCPEGDFIAFDDIGLFPDLDTRFGRYTVATVLAHEWGHAIQTRRGYSLPGVIAELQADCFSGAWMGHIRAGDTPDLRLDDPDLRRAVTGILEFRDAPGTSAEDDGAHGSAFDRLGSYQDGLEKGATSCDAYAVSPPVVIELPFNNATDYSTQGDLTLQDLVTLVPQDLDRFWESAFQASGSSFSPLSGSVETYRAGGPYPRCAGLTTADFEQGVVYCPSPEFVAYEEGGANARLRDSIGDFSVGVLFADRWGQALQHRLGLSTDGEAASLQRDCLTGVWVEDLVPRPTRQQPFSISPGDLDEAVQTYLAFTEDADASADQALARIGAFRNGVFSGLSSCGL